MDLITIKEELQVLKVKLPDDPVLNMSMYSHGNTKEYLAHIVAVLRIIKKLRAECTVQEAQEGCCEADQDVQESPEGCWIEGNCLVQQ